MPTTLIRTVLGSPHITSIRGRRLRGVVIHGNRLSFCSVFALTHTRSASWIEIACRTWDSTPNRVAVVISARRFVGCRLCLLVSYRPFSAVECAFPALYWWKCTNRGAASNQPCFKDASSFDVTTYQLGRLTNPSTNEGVIC